MVKAWDLNWQQLQQKSPRLNVSFQQPYIFHSPYGVNLAFSLYKKDSSYINTDGMLGIQFNASMNKKGIRFYSDCRMFGPHH